MWPLTGGNPCGPIRVLGEPHGGRGDRAATRVVAGCVFRLGLELEWVLSPALQAAYQLGSDVGVSAVFPVVRFAASGGAARPSEGSASRHSSSARSAGR